MVVLFISFHWSDHDDNHDHYLFLEISVLSNISNINPPFSSDPLQNLSTKFLRVACNLSLSSFIMLEMCSPVHFEPLGPQLLVFDPRSKARLEKAGWLPLFQKFIGHNSEVTKSFALNLNGDKEQVRNV